MRKLVPLSALVVFLCSSPLLAHPDYGTNNCTMAGCHATNVANAIQLTSVAGTVNPGGAAGSLPYYTVAKGGTLHITFNVQNLQTLAAGITKVYSVAMSGLDSTGITTGLHMNITPDTTGWTEAGTIPDYFYTPETLYTATQGITYDLGVAANAPSDYYLVDLLMAGGKNTYHYDQKFYVQVVSAPEPMTMALLGLGGVGMLLKRRRREA